MAPFFSIIPYLEDIFQRLDGFGTETTPHWQELLPPDSELIDLFGLYFLDNWYLSILIDLFGLYFLDNWYIL
jgi:hypothetical protein